VWDRLFGTFHLPVGVPAPEAGITEPMPTGLLGQLAYPLRRPRTSPNATFDAR
jgi:sterol desaturase/sphingolipid hydroxylase (fatty acid hydroxylase superfamily)